MKVDGHNGHPSYFLLPILDVFSLEFVTPPLHNLYVLAWIVEGGFSLWVGSRAYDYQSKHYSEGGYETLAKIPLCSGKSVIADKVCQEWVDITAHQIPKMFWKNLDRNNPIYKEMGPLSEERAWHAIIQFSNNCIKRRAYERELLSKAANREDKVDDDTTPASLPTDVPDDVMLSQEDAQKLVQDLSPRQCAIAEA
jgi:hypothetical protein